jgi:hypothetical protein
MNCMPTPSRPPTPSIITALPFVACLLLLIIERVHLLTLFHFRWIDDDQALLWHAATDLARGQFHEPRFYGQAYSTWLEAVPAALLLLLEVPHRIALPVSTLACALFPFILLGLVALREGKSNAALFMLFIPLALPLEYALITAMPRGFFPGVALGTISLVLASSSRGPFFSFLAAFCGGLGLSANPNSAPLVAAAALMEGAKFLRTRSLSSLCSSILGLSIAGALHVAVQAFYRSNPDFMAHASPRIRFSLDAFSGAITHLSDFSSWYSPIPALPVILPFSLVIIPLGVLAKRHRYACFAYFSGMVVLCLALAAPKVHDGTMSIYQPLGRMFLAAPVLWAWALGRAGWSNSAYLSRALIAAMLCLCVLRCLLSGPQVERLAIAPEHQVQATLVSRIEAECARLASLSPEYHPEVIVFGVHRITKILNYACPAVWSPGAIPTFFPAFERRTWRVREELLTKRSRILFYETRRGATLRNTKGVLSHRVLGKNPRIDFIEADPTGLPALLSSINISVQRIGKSRQALRRKGLLPPRVGSNKVRRGKEPVENNI